MSGFIKKAFFTGLRILSSVNLLAVTPLRCISMNNQECKARPQIVNVNRDEPVFILLELEQVHAVVGLTILMTHMQKCVFLML